MTPKNEDALRSAFPEMLKEVTVLECGDGWYVLLHSLFNSLVRYRETEAHFHRDVPPVEFYEIKEKFGSLRLQFRGGDNRVHGIVTSAGRFSTYICENCGQAATPTPEWYKARWIHTACPECWENLRTRTEKV